MANLYFISAFVSYFLGIDNNIAGILNITYNCSSLYIIARFITDMLVDKFIIRMGYEN
jgi:hypothetical protein